MHLLAHSASALTLFCALLTAALRSPLPAGVRATSFDSGIEGGRYAGVLFALHTQSRGSSLEPAAESSAGAPRVFADAASEAPWGGCVRPCVMLVVGRARGAAVPSRVRQDVSVEPLTSARDGRDGPLFFTFPQLSVRPAQCETKIDGENATD